MKTGWLDPPREPMCPHIGAIFAALNLGQHREHDRWRCVCGKVFVVKVDGGRKHLVPKEGTTDE